LGYNCSKLFSGKKMKIQRARECISCALGFMVLSVVTVSASAQSMEYRRGYDQGYRDGIEAQSRQEQPGGRGRISIEEARYGVRGASCDAREQVQQAVGWRRHVSIAVNNNLCGDPAPGVPKRLRVTYRCSNGEVFEVRGPERGVATLYCR
jgi:hypothetical protein